jgi:glycosyltransferase involved in cell wall biosynthesis
MEVRKDLVPNPYFSICVPQYNRTAFLIEACKTLGAQSFRNFELCISDDCSTDGREADLISYLESSGMSFVYRKQEKNTRYDGNLRASIALARGEYCFLLGNDDAFATPDVLQHLHDEMVRLAPASVVITNYVDFATGKQYRRMLGTGVVGAGPGVAASQYRNFAFVSGIIFHRRQAVAWTTSKWDGSEMYQMYIGCRMISAGGQLVAIETNAIRMAIRLPGQEVDSYATRQKLDPCPIEERRLPLSVMGGLVADAVSPYAEGDELGQLIESIFRQILLFTYPYWIIEYRKVQSWKFAVGICIGMRPSNLLERTTLDPVRSWRLSLLYAAVTTAGLLTPLWLFDWLHPRLYAIAKSAYNK